MKKNLRVAMSFSHDLRGDGQTPLFYPVVVSLVCHLFFLVIFVFSPSLDTDAPRDQSVINVSMVSMNNTPENAAAVSAEKPVVEKKAPKIEKPDLVEKPKSAPPPKKTPAVVDQPQPKPKTSLKKKTFQSTQVVKQAIRELEEKVEGETDAQKESTQPDPLKSALERLKKEVGSTETSPSQASPRSDAADSGKAGGKPGKFNEQGRRTAELIDLYRLEIAYQIQKNWAFNEQMAGGDESLAAAIVFKVMPDGEIRDIFFTDRSGNAYLDESAYKAIVKSNPVDGHPNGLAQPYVVMAIRFTPQGIR